MQIQTFFPGLQPLELQTLLASWHSSSPSSSLHYSPLDISSIIGIIAEAFNAAMPHSLAQLPHEILARVTSLISASVIFSRLCSCGDRLLNSKLRTGGISDIDLRAIRTPPQSLIDSVLSLQLRVVSLDLSYTPPRTMQLLFGLPRALSSLNVKMVDATDIFLLGEVDELVARESHLASHSASVWAVRNSYPYLLTLAISANRIEDPFLAIQILGGLPSSLTNLELPSLPPMNVIHALPPNLTRLVGLECVPTAACEALMESLSTLTLKITQIPHSSDVEKSDFSAITTGPRWRLGTTDPLVFPRHLTALRLKCSPAMMKRLPCLPYGLLKLSLGVKTLYSTWNHPSEVLNLVPPSVTQLKLIYFKFEHSVAKDGEVSPSVSRGLPTLHNVKSFSFSYSALHSTEDPDLESESYRQLILALPIVEKFVLAPHNVYKGLGIEHLKLFQNPLRLSTLSAPLAPECLPSDLDAPYTLGKVFPNLQRLVIFACGLPLQTADLNFGALPAKLIQLDSFVNFSSKQLYLLPASLTSVMIRKVVAEFLSESEPLGTESQVSPISAPLRTFDTVISSLCCTWRVLRSNIDGSLAYRPQPSRLSHIAGYTSIGLLTMHWPTVPASPLPQWLTELVITSSCLSGPLSLPLLSKLTIEGRLPERFSLEGLPRLTQLILEGRNWGFGSNITSIACPSTLTYISSTHAKWPLVGLSSKLTYLSGKGIPADQLSTVESLETFLDTAQENDAATDMRLQDWVSKLPSSLTELGVSLCDEELPGIEARLRDFWNHFSSLKSLCIYGTLDHALIDKLYDSLPPSMSISIAHFSRPVRVMPSLLATRAGFNEGEVLIRHGESITEWSSQMLSLVYPRLASSHPSYWGIKVIESDFLQFASFISPSTQQLSLKYLDPEVLPKSVEVWPLHLTELTFTKYYIPDLRPFCLPPNLKKLIIENIADHPTDFIFQALPRTLTHLEIPPWSESLEVPSWPPGLTHLRVFLQEAYPQAMLKSLPKTLIRLDLHEHGALLTSESDFDLLPSSLAILKHRAPKDGLSALEFLEIAKRRGLVWLLDAESILDLGLDLEADFDALLSASRLS